MFSLTSEERLAELHPELALRARKIDALLPSLSIQVAQGLRTWAQQQLLYEQGRTSPGKIVTNCPGGMSWHNFGLAVDLFPEDVIPGQPDWNTANPAWLKMIGAGVSLGLVSGSNWRTFPDWPHFQLTGRFGVDPDEEVREIFKNGGVQAVWDEAGIIST